MEHLPGLEAQSEIVKGYPVDYAQFDRGGCRGIQPQIWKLQWPLWTANPELVWRLYDIASFKIAFVKGKVIQILRDGENNNVKLKSACFLMYVIY